MMGAVTRSKLKLWRKKSSQRLNEWTFDLFFFFSHSQSFSSIIEGHLVITRWESWWRHNGDEEANKLMITMPSNVRAWNQWCNEKQKTPASSERASERGKVKWRVIWRFIKNSDESRRRRMWHRYETGTFSPCSVVAARETDHILFHLKYTKLTRVHRLKNFSIFRMQM